MSMYRQLCLAILLSALIALGGALIASVMNAQVYLAQQLSLKNMDNATALALAVSQSQPSPTSAALATSAMFDSGQYALIKIVDPQGRIIVERRAEEVQHAHDWLAKIIPLNANVGHAEISDGWKQFGQVHLVSQTNFAYDALFKTIVGLVTTMLIATGISGLLGYLVLMRIKKPLDAVVKQARAISNQRFSAIPEPKLPELKQLARAMNKMVLRLKEVFEAEALKLEVLQQEANTDTLTGIANRSFFMSTLRTTLSNEEVDSGVLLLVRVANLAALNQTLGRQDCDAMLRNIAKTLDSYAVGHPHAIAGRLNGSDFGLLIPNAEEMDALGKSTFNNLQAAMSPWVAFSQPAFVGFASFSHGVTMSALLADADINLAEAEKNGGLSTRVSKKALDPEAPQSMTEWREVLWDAIQHRRVRLEHYPVLGADGAVIHEECSLRLQFKAQDAWQPAGKFISIAERLEMTQELDLEALTLGIAELNANKQGPALAINLSASSIKDQDFCKALVNLINTNAEVAPRVWLEFNAEQAFLNFGQFKSFCFMMKETNVMLGIEHLGHHFGKIGTLYDLGLDYIKVDSSFINDIDQNKGNQIFLHGLTDIAHHIGIKVIAEGVTNDAERKMAFSLGFDGVTGTGVKV